MAQQSTPLREAVAKIKNPEMRRFFEDGANFIENYKATEGVDPSFAVVPKTTEWRRWEFYLKRRIGNLPWAMREAKAGRLTSATMPARFPHWFDGQAEDFDPPPEREEFVSPEARARISAGFEALGDELAMGKPEAERRRMERRHRHGETVTGRQRPPEKSWDDIRAALRDQPGDFSASPALEDIMRRKRGDGSEAAE